MIRDAARDFAQNEIAPIAAEFDESGEFPHATIKTMGEMGFMGIEIPEEYGGAGLDTLAYVLALEEICRADASHGVIMSVNNSLVCHGIYRFGTDKQKDLFLSPLAGGEKLGAYSLTEPQAGSDASNMRCTAVYDAVADEYVINGVKTFISNGTMAHFVIVLCQTNPEARPVYRGQSSFIVDKGSKGFEVTELGDKMGIRMTSTTEMSFDQVRIPEENLIGPLNRGFYQVLEFFDESRVMVAAQALEEAEEKGQDQTHGAYLEGYQEPVYERPGM